MVRARPGELKSPPLATHSTVSHAHKRRILSSKTRQSCVRQQGSGSTGDILCVPLRTSAWPPHSHALLRPLRSDSIQSTQTPPANPQATPPATDHHPDAVLARHQVPASRTRLPPPPRPTPPPATNSRHLVTTLQPTYPVPTHPLRQTPRPPKKQIKENAKAAAGQHPTQVRHPPIPRRSPRSPHQARQ